MGPKSVTDVPLHEYYCHRICIGLGGYSNYGVLHSTNCYFQLVFPLDTCWLSIAITIATREHKTDSVETSARASLLIINLSLLSFIIFRSCTLPKLIYIIVVRQERCSGQIFKRPSKKEERNKENS